LHTQKYNFVVLAKEILTFIVPSSGKSRT